MPESKFSRPIFIRSRKSKRRIYVEHRLNIVVLFRNGTFLFSLFEMKLPAYRHSIYKLLSHISRFLVEANSTKGEKEKKKK